MRQTFRKIARVGAAASVVGVLLVSAAPPSSAAGFTFTQGDIVVERLGVTGGLTLKNTGNPIFLDEYTTGGTLVGSLAMPTTTSGSNVQMIESGSATYDGEMTNSGDGHYLVVSGYDSVAPASASLTGSLSSAVPRVAASVDVNGNIDSSTALPDFASANNYRGATSPDGKTFYLSGNTGMSSNGGLAEAPDGDTTASNEIDNYAGSGEVTIYNGLLYIVSRTAGTGFTIATVGPLPITTTAAPTPLPGFPTAAAAPLASPDSIFPAQLNPADGMNPDTIYVADDTTGGGEIEKWSDVAGTWSLTGDITATMVRGLTGTVSGSTATLYATSSGSTSETGTLFSVTDTSGYDAAPSAAAATSIATAATNETFRGVALAPTPQPNPQVPEAPWAILLPASAGVVLCAGIVLSRRRATTRLAR